MSEDLPNNLNLDNFKDSLLVGTTSVNTVVEQFEKEIQIKELDKVKQPYASLHCLDSSLFTIYDKIMRKDAKEDDQYVLTAY